MFAVLVFLTILTSARSNHAADATPKIYGKVNTKLLNVRARPGIRFEVVCQISEGTMVRIVDRNDEWFGIEAPQKSEAWIPANQLSGNMVTGEQVSIYSGPGSIFTTYDTISNRDSVEVIQIIDDKWAKIRPPRNAVVWVHRDFVDVEDSEELSVRFDSNENETLEQPTLPDNVRIEEDVAISAPADDSESQSQPRVIMPIAVEPLYRGVVFIGTIKEVEKIGIIVPAAEKQRPFQYTIAVPIHDTHYPLAYLNYRDGDLTDWLWKKVKVAGGQQWMKGRPRPLIQVQQISEVTED